MFSPLLSSVIARHDMAVVDDATLDGFAADNEIVSLLFPGDSNRLAESDDVAIILPELVEAFQGAFTPAVVAPASERKLQLRYRFNAFPALVFLRRGEYLGAIKRVLDWDDYLNAIADIIVREPSEPPRFEMPDGCATPVDDDHIH